MTPSRLGKVALLACLCVFQTVVLANSLEEYQVYEADIDSDGDIDYLLKLSPEEVEIPYDINLQLERSAQQYILRQQDDGSFSVELTSGAATGWELIDGDLTAINYTAGGELEIAIKTYGTDPQVIITNQASDGTLATGAAVINQSLESGALGGIVDINNDGLDDVVIANSKVQTLSSVAVNKQHDNVQNLSFNSWVGADGSANASLPIWVPKGAGPTPSIVISYASNRGNGPLGLGTHLSGSSKIHYCPPTADVKGTMAATPFTTEEDLCLDGQHLVLVEGSHLVNGAVYIPETNSHTQLKLVNSIFEMQLKSGGRLTYGLKRTHSAVSNTIEWYLTRAEDEFGNGYTLGYQYDAANSINPPLLDRVSYGDVVINLGWEVRPEANDVVTMHRYGTSTTLKHRLKNIAVTRDDQRTLKSYTFSYKLNNSKRSVLESVAVCNTASECDYVQCESDANCVSASMQWNPSDKSFSATLTTVKSFPNKDPDQKMQYLDINGDGYLDVMYPAVNNGTWRYHLGSDNGFGVEKNTERSTGSGKYASYARPISLGADHMSGLIVARSSISNETTGEGAVWVCKGNEEDNADKFIVYKDAEEKGLYSYHKNFQGINAHWCDPEAKSPGSWLTGPSDPGGRVGLMGVTHFFMLLPVIAETGKITEFIEVGANNNTAPLATTLSNPIAVLDMNNDGLQDIFIERETQLAKVYDDLPLKGTQIEVLYTSIIEEVDGSRVQFDRLEGEDLINDQDDPYYSNATFADFNGDGYIDVEKCPVNDTSKPCLRTILKANLAATRVEASNPARVSKTIGEGEAAKVFSSPKYYSDLNGDALVDLVWVGIDGIYTEINQGGGYYAAITKVTSVLPDDSFAVQFMDYDSDGLKDILFSHDNTFKIFVGKRQSDGENTGQFKITYSENELSAIASAKIFKGYRYSSLRSISQVTRDLGDEAWNYDVVSLPYFQEQDAPTVFDYNHDGMQDLVFFKESAATLYATSLTSDSLKANKLSGLTDSFGNVTTFTYKTTKQAPVSEFYTTRFPYKNIANTAMVVDTMSFNSAALPAPVTTSYIYEGALYHMQGRGFLGFNTRTVTDENRGIVTQETYEQAYPLTGRIKQVKTYHKDAVANRINQQDNNWNFKSLGYYNSQIKVPFLQETTQRQFAQPGQQTRELHAVNAFDDFGNMLTRTQTIKDVASVQLTQTLVAKYKHINDSGEYIEAEMENWRLGFRTKLTKTSAVDAYSQSRTTTWTPYLQTNRVEYVTENQGSPHELITKLDYTATGQLHSKQLSSGGSSIHKIATLPDKTTRTEMTSSDFFQGYLPQTITNATGHNAQIEYHADWHQPTKQTSVQGLTTSLQYDNGGNVVASTAGDGSMQLATSQYCSNISGCPTGAFYRSTVMQMHTTQKGFLAPPQYTYYDQLGRVVREQTQNADGQAVYQDYSYDALSRLSTTSLPYMVGEKQAPPVFTRYSNYDLYDRPLNISYHNGSQGSVSFSHSVASNQLTTTRTITNVIPDLPNSIQTDTTTYDALGQIAHIKNNASQTENTYTYDGLGNIRKVDVAHDGAPLKTVSAQFNNAGYKTQITDPDTGTYHYEYDSLGLMRKQTDARSNVYTFTYDVLNNQTHSDLNGNEDGRWIYSDSVPGLLTQKYKDGFSESYKYDDLLRMKQVDTQLKSLAVRQFKYQYDKAGRLDTAHYPSGFSVQAGYNNLGYLTAYKNPKNNHNYWQAEDMDAFGNWVGVRLGNNIQTQKDYDPASGLLKSIVSTKTNTGDVQNLHYKWDANGNLRSRKQNSLEEAFSYDGTGRLTQAVTTGLASGTRTLNYGYDGLGNLNFKSDLVSGSSHSNSNKLVYGTSTNGPSRLQSVIRDGATILSYGYDDSGNMTQRGNTNLSYTAANKPSHIWKTDGPNRVDSFFEYDTGEQRFYQKIEKNAATTQEIYYYGAGYEEVFDTNPTSQYKIHKQKAYVGGVMIHTYTQSNDPDADLGKFADIQYLHHDHLGSTQTITSASGEVLQSLAFDPFGKARQSNWEDVGSSNGKNPDWNEISLENTSSGFTGHEMLADFDLIHMGGRIYDPTVGRMMSADPYVQAPFFGQSYNRYSYVWNNPLSATDPSGYLMVLCGWTINGDGTSYQNICNGDGSSGSGQLDTSKDENLFGGQENTEKGESGGVLAGSEFQEGYAQAGGTTTIDTNGGTKSTSNNGYQAANGSFHVSATVSISSVSTNRAPTSPPEVMSFLDTAQFAADLLATSEIPFLSQAAGAANALTYAVRGNWAMAGSSLIGMIPGFGAGADAMRLGMWAAKGLGKAKATLKTMGKTCCFVAGTLVLTSEGHANIEDIEVGDKVLSKNTATGEVAYKEITDTFVEQNRPIYQVRVVNQAGHVTNMETTDDHPFYVLRDEALAQGTSNQLSAQDAATVHGGSVLATQPHEAGMWKLTKQLTHGDEIATHENGVVTVLSAQFTGTYDLTFNLSVADFHTYFVTNQNVLVHNCEKCKGGVCGVLKSVDPKTLIGRQGKNEMVGSQVKRLRKNMKENGFDPNKPINAADVDGKLIILNGHHRTKAAIGAGIKRVPVIIQKATRKQGDELLREAAEARL